MSQTKLLQLIELASEPSSERRRELLREVTNLFFTGGEEAHSGPEMELFDDVLGRLAVEMEEAVRVELAERMADASRAPSRLIAELAADSIAVAGPVLTRSPALSEEDQMHVAQSQGEAHLSALSRRAGVSSSVTDEIVRRGNDATLNILLRNPTAALSREAQETIVDRAQANPELHEAVVERQNLPPDLLNEMYFLVEAQLRDKILEKNNALDPADLDAALSVGRKKLATRDGALPFDYPEEEAVVRIMKRRGQITPQALSGMLRAGMTTRFLMALAELADVDFHTSRRILERKELDALAIVCKAADFDRALFLTFAILILDADEDAMAKARRYGDLYSELPKDAATRTLRFWRMRRQTGDVAA
jgi:uncharacterized protein (DUF2336 family)